MSQKNDGFSLIEVIVAAVIGSLIAAGVLSAYVAAARMSQVSNRNYEYAQAISLGQETLEKIRNKVAADDLWFTGNALSGWQDDPDPMVGAGTESILLLGAARKFCVEAKDCDGVGGGGDCFAVHAKVCWDGSLCPADGSPCS